MVAPALDKAQLAAQIGQFEAQLAQAEMDLQSWREDARKQGGCLTWATVGLVAGVVGFFFLAGLWSMGGAVLAVASLLALVLTSIDRGKATRAAAKTEAAIVSMRGQLGQMRAQMMM
ncbi:MAG: hypothetical protein WC869_10555 [Phycisphaerae bacterium]|jgi:hypothetical protein